MPAPDRLTHSALIKAALAAIFVIVFVLRISLALRYPNIARADEIFQTLEPAHRFYSGWGIVTWEWRQGIRSPLFPELLAGLMRLSSWLHRGPGGYLPLIAATLAAISLLPIWAAFRMGLHSAGYLGALFAMLLCAIWPDLVYYAPKALTEIQAGNLLVVAIALAELLPAEAARESRTSVAVRCFVIGALLGLVFDLRFQLVPALVLVAGWAARNQFRWRWLPLIGGALVPLAVTGIVDLLTLGSFYQSVWKNLQVNLLQGRSRDYGAESPIWYAAYLVRAWGAAIVPLAGAFVIGARRARLCAAVAIIVVLTHSLIAHKEISFIYAAFPPALIAAGIGTAEAVRWLHRALFSSVPMERITAATAALWFAIMTCTSISGDFPSRWRGGADYIAAFATLRNRADLCGIGFYDLSLRWGRTAGYATLDRPVPMLMLPSPAAFGAASGSINYLLSSSDLARYIPGFTTERCWSEFCLMRAAHICTPIEGYDLNEYLEQTGN
jgi:hypothetical protein